MMCTGRMHAPMPDRRYRSRDLHVDRSRFIFFFFLSHHRRLDDFICILLIKRTSISQISGTLKQRGHGECVRERKIKSVKILEFWSPVNGHKNGIICMQHPTCILFHPLSNESDRVHSLFWDLLAWIFQPLTGRSFCAIGYDVPCKVILIWLSPL